MLILRKAADRGHANHGWLDSHHTFSFGDYHDPSWMGFRTLRVLNDDRVAPGNGFPPHPHRDMEIISYVLSGALEHKDSMGNGRVIRAGEFQYMAAGSGVVHSEFNPSSTEPVHFLQMWIVPDHRGGPPRYGEKSLAAAPAGRFHVVLNRDGAGGAIAIQQDASLLLGRLAKGDRLRHVLAPDRHAWVHVTAGTVAVNGSELTAGDSGGLSVEPAVELEARESAEALVFDLA